MQSVSGGTVGESGQGWGAGVCRGGRGASPGAVVWGEVGRGSEGAGREDADPSSSKGSADSTLNFQFLSLLIGWDTRTLNLIGIDFFCLARNWIYSFPTVWNCLTSFLFENQKSSQDSRESWKQVGFPKARAGSVLPWPLIMASGTWLGFYPGNSCTKYSAFSGCRFYCWLLKADMWPHRTRWVPSSEYSGISSSDCDLDHRIKILRILSKCHDRRTMRQDPPVDGGGTL